MTTSSVQTIGGVPTLTVNGAPVPANAYITYFTNRAAYEDFAAAGFRLYSVAVYFSSQTIQELGPVPPFSPGIFDGEKPDFTIADRLFEQILAACPDAYIFPRVNLSLPLCWEEENPDELCDTTRSAYRRPCFSSDKWAEDTKKALDMFLDHVENAPYRDHICGYQLAGGNTEEWFSFDQVGSVGRRSREKFAQRVREQSLAGTEEEYYAFLSQIVAERICEFAAFTKAKLKRPLVVGSFYGYTFETPQRASCHHALGTVLRSPDIDFLCSPVSYMQNREAGIDHPCMLPVDSLKLHGKLYFAENDTRTHLTTPPYDIPHFQKPVWMPREKWLAAENLKLHFARALTHGHALWWFDMWGGWYRYPLYMEMLGDFLRITGASLRRDLRSVSEAAVLADEAAYCRIDDSRGSDVCGKIRRALGRMGTPYDAYLASDYEAIRGRYKALILLVPCMTPAMRRIAEENPGCLIVDPQNCAITPAELREFCRGRGVHIYSDKDAVIHVNRSYLFLHTASVGRAQLHLPRGMRLRQIAGDPVDLGSTVLPRFSGYLFEIEPA